MVEINSRDTHLVKNNHIEVVKHKERVNKIVVITIVVMI